MKTKSRLKNLMPGDLFSFEKPTFSRGKDEIWLLCGLADRYVYGDNAFDVHPEYEEDKVFTVCDSEVIFVGRNAYGYSEQP